MPYNALRFVPLLLSFFTLLHNHFHCFLALYDALLDSFRPFITLWNAVSLGTMLYAAHARRFRAGRAAVPCTRGMIAVCRARCLAHAKACARARARWCGAARLACERCCGSKTVPHMRGINPASSRPVSAHACVCRTGARARVCVCARARTRARARFGACVRMRVRGTVVCANHRVRLARVGRAVRKQRVVVPEAEAEEKRRRCACCRVVCCALLTRRARRRARARRSSRTRPAASRAVAAQSPS